MQLKIVVRVSYQDDKGKQKLMKTTASFSGITSISIEDKKLIVIGEIDPIKLLEKLRKLCNADIGTMGSLEEPKKEKPKKEESKKDEPKKEETEKDPKKQEEKMNKYFVEMAKAYESFNHNRNYTTLYIVHNAEENPNSCVTC